MADNAPITEPSRSDVIHLDGRQVRCLAHPLRTRILASLRMNGASTSAQLAERLDTNTGVTSYHLRQLAEAELVTEDQARGTARERWWEPTHQYSSWHEADYPDGTDEHAAAQWLARQNARLKNAWREHWHDTASHWTPEWRHAADSSDLRLELTPEQLQSMNTEILAIVQRFSDNGPTPGGDPQPVVVLLDTFPAPELPI